MTNVYCADDSHIAVIEQRPSGFGPSVWVGELRTLDDQPVTAWAHVHGFTDRWQSGLTPCQPISVGASEAEVLALLVARARDIKRLIA